MTRIAVIGAGIGGATLASRLAHNHEVVVFEKGRGVGGRMASRYAGAFTFDHGAQYFTIRDQRFVDLLRPLQAAGAVAPWLGPIARIENAVVTAISDPRDIHYVGVPNMNDVAKALVEGLDLRAGVDIAPLRSRTPQGWMVADTAGSEHGLFDWVISTTTAHQTMALFAEHAPALGPLTTATMAPCYALMLGFSQPMDLPWAAARVSGSAIEWIAVNSTKPGRDVSSTTLVVHSTSDWAARHLGQDLGQLGAVLGAALRDATGIDPDAAAYAATHRWASARRLPQPGSEPYVDPVRRLAATGDWTTGSRVEDTALSALDLADLIERA